MPEWRAGDEYRGPGPGIWRVARVSAAPAMIIADAYRQHGTAKGTVVLVNDALGWEIVAPQDHERLNVLEKA